MYSALQSKLYEAQREGLSWVCWRLPGTGEPVQLGPGKATRWDGGMPSEGAFVFAPFDRRDHSPWILTPSAEKEPDRQPPHTPVKQEKAQYIRWVNTCLDSIRKGDFGKLVAARVHQESRPDFDAVNHFLELSGKYPNAFCYLWYSPSTGLWLGATPELLLDFSPESIRTVALAGTQPANAQAFGGKEQEEQQLVVDYVYETLKPLADGITISPKGIIPSGHLVHLVSELQGTPKPGTTFSSVLQALHPTPAVAGLPKQNAVDFIRTHEGFDRAYYSGFLGPAGNGVARLFVNLRCMQVSDHVLFYYVGAGITSLSDAEKEWQETEEKRKVIAPDPKV